MQMDQHTFVTVSVLVGLLLAVHGAVLWWTRRTYPSQSRWTIAGLLLLVSVCLWALRPIEPDWISIVGSDTSLVIASILYLEGAREFRGLPPRSWFAYAAGVATVAGVAFFDYAVPSPKARVSVVSSFLGIVFILTAVRLLKGRALRRSFGLKLTGGMFGLFGAAILVRALYFNSGRPLKDLTNLSGIDGAVYAIILASVAGVLLGIVLLADERAKSDLADAKDKAARAQAEVAERKRAEAVLRESEERFRSLADTAPVMVWISGLDKLYTFFNKPWLDFTGRTLEQELGYAWARGVHPEDLDRCLSVYSSAFDARRDFQMEYRLRRTDGEYRWILDQGKPLHREGEFAGYIGSCIDVSGQKLVEERLRASEFRLTEAQRLAKVGSWERDIESDTIHWSEEILGIFGVPKELPRSFTGFLSYVHPKDRARIQETDRQICQGTGPADVEYRIIRPDGEVRFVRSIAEIIYDHGMPSRMVGATQDITEQVEARELLRKSEERLKNAERLAHVGNWHWHIEANRLTWSEEMFRIFGKPQDYTPTCDEFFEMLLPRQGANGAATKKPSCGERLTFARFSDFPTERRGADGRLHFRGDRR